MCLFPPTNDFAMGAAELMLDRSGKDAFGPQRRRVPAFYLDTTEVSAGPFQHWLRRGKGSPPDHPDLAASDVTWDQAAAYAEKFGKRLPDETEYEYAATACGKYTFPWGNSAAPLQGKPWTFGPVGQPAYDRLVLPGQPPVFGLYSNVAEWTTSWPGSDPTKKQPEPTSKLRVIRGAPAAVVFGNGPLGVIVGPRERYSFASPVSRPAIGFRCARSVRPRLRAEDFTAPRTP
jgi:formylglycine-generating enzyme required for sulfatase activity